MSDQIVQFKKSKNSKWASISFNKDITASEIEDHSYRIRDLYEELDKT